MNIDGKLVKVAARWEDVPIGLDAEGQKVIIRLYAPNLTELERGGDDFPEMLPPIVPGKFVKGDDGKLLRDYHRRPIPMRDSEDPAYLKAVRELSILQSVALLVACARDVTWKAQRADFPDKPLDYYRAIRRELVEAGITAGAVAMLNNTAARLATTLNVDEAKAARDKLGAPEESSPKP